MDQVANDRHSFSSSVTFRFYVHVLVLPLFLCFCTSSSNTAVSHAEPLVWLETSDQQVSFQPVRGFFPLAENGTPVSLYISSNDYPGVKRAFGDLQLDLERVTGTKPEIFFERIPSSGKLVIAGSLGNNQVIDRLANEGKIDVSEVEGRWETFRFEVVRDPLPGVEEALVIFGSDKRGTIFGIYELSQLIGVSPWYWWADVPVVQQRNLFVSPQPYSLGEPAVKYRGIFLNNENPSLLGWVNHTFSGFNHHFYSKVFELILRNKGNYLWPAMWGKAFHDDDPLNGKTADEYGIVIGYSHHEPMGRAHVEWARYGMGPWNYETNPQTLQSFWREGIERLETFESSVTLGMRGDGDEPMSDEANIELMERIFRDQRTILNTSAKQDVDDLLLIWALYKEVLDYFEQGLRVPDDVMILLANDNWGNIRYLPDPNEALEHPGGWGMYYHFDYVGGPRNYKWINTIQISRIWEQMGLAWQHNIDKLWLVNVGDLKPMELPISFFLDYAWSPDAMTVEKMDSYSENWARQQFGPEYAGEIAHLLNEYTRINSRRKPELLDADTYSLHYYREFEQVVEDYNTLTIKARRIFDQIPQNYRDAYFQLVMYPVEASANVNKLYLSVAQNRHYAQQGRALTNSKAENAERHFAHNDRLDQIFHQEIAGGKWVHMMDQTRIGYTSWQQPRTNIMPQVNRISLPNTAEMGVSIEGASVWWPLSARVPALPETDRHHRQLRYFEIFNRGSQSFTYTVRSEADWVRLSSPSGELSEQKRIFVEIDWDSVPEGRHRIPLTIRGSEGTSVTVYVPVDNRNIPALVGFDGFIESNGVIAIESPQYSRNIVGAQAGWKHIPQLGRTSSSMAPFPVLAPSADPVNNSAAPRLEYDLYFDEPGEVRVTVYLSPTKNYSKDYRNPDGIRFGLSLNDDVPQILNMHYEMDGGFITPVWYRWVGENIIRVPATLTVNDAGINTLKLWMVDTGIVVQRIVLERGETKPTYLGPPASR